MQVLVYGALSAVLTLVFLLSSPPPGHAFRCGSGMVSVGDSKGKVLIECGKPTFKEKVADGDPLCVNGKKHEREKRQDHQNR